jgi:hypothetical protein
VWRLENAVFGKRAAVNLFGDIVALASPACASLISSNHLSPIYSEPGGFQVCFLKKGELEELRQQIKVMPGTDFINRPRISTADGVDASMYVGSSVLLNGVTNDVGLTVAYFPRVRSHSTDLFARIIFCEARTNQTAMFKSSQPTNLVSIQTNLRIAARLQIPKGSGVLLLKEGRFEDPPQTDFAILLDPP